MAKALVSDPLWAAMEPLLPGEPAKPKGGRPRVADRVALSGMILVLRSGIPGEMPPAEIGRSGMTCWRGLRDRQAAGVWARLPRTRLEPERMPTSSMEPGLARRGRHGCEKGGSATGPNPPDRGKAGTKRHVVVDRVGPPLSLSLSGANRHDNLVLAPTLDAVPPVRHGRGRPRYRPDKLHVDKAYGHRRCRTECRRRPITPRIACRGGEASERWGRYRGWLSAHRHGSPAFVASPSATSVARTST